MQAVPEQPNIVLIMTDQQRADFTRAAGFALDTMPFLDALADDGVRFSGAYTPTPVCAPARSSLLSGRFPGATRVRQNSATQHITRSTDLIDVLRQRGYSVNLAGKNHSYLTEADFDFHASYMHTGGGRPERRTPTEERFDAWLASLDHGVTTEPSPCPLECQLPYRVVSDAIECLDGRGERPFFLWLSFAEPHNPYQVPEPYFSLFPAASVPERVAGPEAAEVKGGAWRWLRDLIAEKRPGYDAQWRRYRANYCGMLRLIDDQLRRFVAYLDAEGLRDNTLLIFCSDHGDYAGDYGLQRKGAGLPECLIRVPLIVNGPDVRPGITVDDLVSLVDVMPTICELLGSEIPFGVQGRSLWPMLTGDPYPTGEFASVFAELGFGGLPWGEDERPPLHFPYDGSSFDELNSVTQSGNLKMVRTGRWKLLFDVLGRGELYNLETDPGELRDLWDDPHHRDVRQQMVELLLRWTIRAQDDLPLAAYTPKRLPHNWHTHASERPGREATQSPRA